MIYQPTTGARDLLPLDVAQKRWIEARLRQVFHRWGYHQIITSTLERLDTLMAGGAIERSTVIQLQQLEEDPLGLRPELTASIARTAVTRVSTYPQRLYYYANVFRRPPEKSHSSQQEFYQAGVELLGANGVLADAEVVLLVLDCLKNLEVPAALILGEAGLTRSLLSTFPDSLREKVRSAIANLDRIALESMPMSDELRDRALALLDLRGNPTDVLQRVENLSLDQTQQETMKNLKALIDLLQQSLEVPMTLDLSLIQTFDYYTGIIFEVVSPSGQTGFGQGGRYDQLLSLYHPQGESIPGIGFSLQIEELHEFLLAQGKLATQNVTSDWLVVSETEASYAIAFKHAQELRAADLRVEIELHGHDRETIRSYARRRRIPKIAWIGMQGTPEIEAIS
jgi:ATP phosphoribosyltransferase regulatory subunit